MNRIQKRRLAKILTDGFFPKELPINFKPINFELIIKNLGPIESDQKSLATIAISHNVTRFSSFTRKIDIPNPVTFARFALEIVNNFDVIVNKKRKSPYSLTFPVEVTDEAGRSFRWEHDWQKWKEAKIIRQAGFKYVLKTDISNFYPSIYTHIIPWIIHGKKHSKANANDRALLGNILDKKIRNCQDKQTQGIQVGPDTSFLISELILNSLDDEILKELRSYKIEHKAARFVDDYEFYFCSNDDAKHSLNIISRILSSYELALNPLKTEINELPFEFDKEWVARIRGYPQPDGAEKTKRQLVIDYFGYILKLQRKHSSEQVLSYALSRIEMTSYLLEDNELFFSLLLNLAVYDSGVLKYVIRFINLDVTILSDGKVAQLFKRVIPKILKDCSERGRDNDVLWALILCYLFKVKITASCSKLVYKNGNSLVKLMCLDLARLEFMDLYVEIVAEKEDFFGDEWILNYTIFTSDEFLVFRGEDDISQNPFVKHLICLDVKFYEAFSEEVDGSERVAFVRKLCGEMVDSEYKIEVDGEIYNFNDERLSTCDDCGEKFFSPSRDQPCSQCWENKMLKD